MLKPSKVTRLCTFLIIALFRVCHPEALGDEGRIGGGGGGTGGGQGAVDPNNVAAAAAAAAEGAPAAFKDRLHLPHKDVALKQSFVESPAALDVEKRKSAAAAVVDPNALYSNLKDGPYPAGPAGVDKKQVHAEEKERRMNDHIDDDAERHSARRERDPAAAQRRQEAERRRDERRSGGGGGEGAAAAAASTRIADHPDCRDDVRRICVDGNLNLNNNFAVLDCLQRDRRDGADLSEGCHHHVWSYKKNLTQDERFDAAAFEVCQPVLEAMPDCQKQEKGTGNIISCLINNIENVTVDQCHQFLVKMEAIVFSDFRLVNKFVDRCRSDIVANKCGRLPGVDEDAAKIPHKQGATIACLQGHVSGLKPECRKEILRISELQADDYHLDRPLYFACREDRERFCERLTAGRGQVYKCLMRHKFDADMSSDCTKELTRRQLLISEDWKASKGLVVNCRKDVKQNQCLNQARTDALSFKHGKLSIIILCLENAMHLGHDVAPECQAELLDLRKQLMEDFSITPELVSKCSTEITKECDGGLHRKGKTLHCLMDLMRPNPKKGKARQQDISEGCRGEMSKLMKEADVGSDFRIDTMLQEACQAVADTACRDIRPGDARIITCLLEKMDTEKMIPECEERLLEIQYFITRDWTMDPRIYRKCRHDASNLCNAAEAWKDMNPNFPIADDKKAHQGYVLACLFRHADNNNMKSLSANCASELKRAMRERAVSVHLQPELEEPCLLDLGKYCSENVEKGNEVDCLQDNYDKLTEDCQQSVMAVTEREADDIEMDRLMVKACSPVMTKYCKNLIDNDIEDEGRMMDCLIRHKNVGEMNEKCRSGVVHFQLLSLKDVSFNYKFKSSCKNDVVRNCKKIQNKIQAVTCLSEHVRNDTLTDNKHRISPECRQQLKVELLQRNEDAQLDPDLMKVCKSDMKNFCDKEDFGAGRKLKCLRQHRKDLSSACHKMIFKRDREIAKDNSIDYSLQVTCKAMIDQYCENMDEKDILECLKPLIDSKHFDHRCRNIVIDRMRTQKSDYRLSPNLEKACSADIPKYCKQFLKKSEPFEMEGVVIKCLSKQYSVPKRLTEKCAAEIKVIIEESQKDVRQNHVLYKACQNDIDSLCSEFQNGDGEDAHGKIEECLKNRLNDIRSKKCKREVAELLQETKADIEVDPLLEKACAKDLRQHCPDVPSGDGQRMSCILAALEDDNIAPHMTKDCKEKLRKRKEMWELAARIAPVETLAEIGDSILSSPHRNYFAVVLFGCLAFIFTFGLLCGRVTKRLHRQVKDR